jgi:hypothetical protein
MTTTNPRPSCENWPRLERSGRSSEPKRYIGPAFGVYLTPCQEADKAAKEQEKREFDIARGNPLLNPKDFNVKRRYVLLSHSYGTR